MSTPSESKLREYLNLYWLRPENGLITTFKSQAFVDIPFDHPRIDISCGDGLFMFIHLGGQLSLDTDYFLSTRAREFTHGHFANIDDPEFIDIYNSYDENYRVGIESKPSQIIDFGTDWKQNLLNKAAKLDIYGNLILHDNNITPLPFKNGEFRSVYSNSIYWVPRVDALVKDINRLLSPGGIAVLEVATPTLMDTLDQLTPLLGAAAVDILDRGRRMTKQGVRTPSEWEKMFRDAGFQVEDARCVWPDKLLVDIWNIGLRPVSHLLIQMVEHLSPSDRQRIKREWVDIFFTLCKPLLDLPLTYEHERSPYLCYILSK